MVMKVEGVGGGGEGMAFQENFYGILTYQ